MVLVNMQRDATTMKGAKIIRKILLSVCSIGAALAICEIGFRVLGIQYPLMNEWLLYTSNKRISPKYIFEKLNVGPVNPSDGKRIVVMGDSFSEEGLWRHLGIESYPELLTSMFHERDESVHVYNYGIGASGSDQEFRYFVDHIIPLHPDLIIWQLYANDVWENVIQPVYTIDSHHRLEPLDASANWLYRRQELYNRLPLKNLLMHSYIIKTILFAFERFQYQEVPESYIRHPQDWGIDKIRAEVSAMDALSKQYGFDVVYVLIPPQALYMHVSGRTSKTVTEALMYHRAIDAILSGKPLYVAIRFEDPSVADNQEEVLDTIYLHDEDTNLMGDKHISQKGHAIIAQKIFAVVCPQICAKH